MRGSFADVFRPPWRSCAVIVSVGGPTVTLVCWYFGADVSHAVAVAACLCAVGIAWIAWTAWTAAQPLPWRETDERHDGGRWDVARLSWSLHRGRGRVGPEALRRVQAIGRQRLALHQLDPLDPSHGPAVEHLIGAAALSVLRSSGAGLSSAQLPTMRSFVACLDALDSLEPLGTDVGRQLTVSWRLRVMLRRRGRHAVLALLRRSARRVKERHAD